MRLARLHRPARPATPDSLAGYPCLAFLYRKSRQVRPWLFQRPDGGGEAHAHTPQGAIATDHVDSLIEVAKAGGGIVQQLSVSLAEPLRSGALLPLLEAWQAPGPAISVLYQQKHQRAARVKVFVDFIAELFRENRGVRSDIRTRAEP